MFAQGVLVPELVRDSQVAGRRGRAMLMRLLRMMELLIIDILLVSRICSGCLEEELLKMKHAGTS